MSSAFAANAFQSDPKAFQIDTTTEPPPPSDQLTDVGTGRRRRRSLGNAYPADDEAVLILLFGVVLALLELLL